MLRKNNRPIDEILLDLVLCWVIPGKTHVLICCLNCKLYVRMGIILLILFSKQPSDFLSIQIFWQSMESHTANLLLHQMLWLTNRLCWTQISLCKAFWKQQSMYGFLSFLLHQILCCLKFNASSNPWCRQVSFIEDWWLDKKTRQKVSRQNFFCGFVNKREQLSDRPALTPRLVLAIASQTALRCVFLGKSESGSLIKDHLNHVA